MCVCVPWRRQLLLQELLDLVDIDLHLTVEGHKGRVGSRRQVLQVGRLPNGAIPRRDVLSGKSVDRRDVVEKHVRGFLFLPFQVDGGNVEDDPFEPQDHEESLGEGTVADALAIAASLHDGRTQ